MKNAIIYHENFRQYDMGPDHPLRGDRYNCLSHVFSHETIQDKRTDITFVNPKPATKDDVMAVHGEEYIRFINLVNEKGGMISIDTPIPPGLLEIAKLFAGANILAGRLICEDIFRRVVVLGLGAHHAGYDFGGGFCIINDIAIMIEYLRQNYDAERILVIDYDAHCGDGTQDIFYHDADILCIDFHQDPLTLFPGKGFAYQVGLGKGKGSTVNIPLPRGSSDENFIAAFNEICLPIATEFKPEIIIATGGLDAHYADPLSQLNLTINGYFRLMNSIVKLSRQLCENKLALIMGSGYVPEVTPLGWRAMISAMLEIEKIDIEEPVDPPEHLRMARGEDVRNMIDKVKLVQKRYWKNV